MKFMEDAQVGEYHRRPETGGRKKTGSDRHTCKQNPPKTGMNKLEKYRRQNNLGMGKLNVNSHCSKGGGHCVEREAIGSRDSFRTTLGTCDPE